MFKLSFRLLDVSLNYFLSTKITDKLEFLDVHGFLEGKGRCEYLLVFLLLCVRIWAMWIVKGERGCEIVSFDVRMSESRIGISVISFNMVPFRHLLKANLSKIC